MITKRVLMADIEALNDVSKQRYFLQRADGLWHIVFSPDGETAEQLAVGDARTIYSVVRAILRYKDIEEK
jgi:mannose/cellobiose epimerase-like protein (N-acyl-D-glucosamine 2-epimerase family)